MADDLILRPDAVRKYIGSLGGVCQILDGIPGFFDGDNDEGQAVWLTKEELGNYQPFETAWKEICGNRLKEAKDIAAFLRHNKRKLIQASEVITHTDMDSAALFPVTTNPDTGEGTSLETSAERYGMDVTTPEEATADRLGRNIPR